MMARKTAFDLRNEYDKSKHNKASDNTYSTFAKTQSILGDSKTYMDTQSDYRKNVANNQLAYIEEQKRRKEERIEQQMRYDAMEMMKTGRLWYKPGDFQQANNDINPSSDTMKAVNNVYAAYQDTEDVESAKKRADEARKNLENVARIVATMPGDYAKAYSGYLNDHANYYKQASEGMDDLKDIYGYYKTEKAYNDAKKEQELKDKYAGFSYDQIKAEKAKLDPDSEEYRFLDNYRENVGYSTEKDYEKAIEDLSENKPGKEQKIYATWKKISDDYSYEDVKRIIEANENNDIDSLFDDYTEDQIGDVISEYTFAAMDVEENYFDETQDLKRDQETFKKEHAFERYYNSVVANSDFPILSQYDYDPMQNTRIVSGKDLNYSDKGSNEKDLKQVYDYMNTDPDKIDELWTFGFAADYKEKGYAFATEKEKEVFNYLYNSRDLDKARSYLKEMEPIWTQRREQYGDSVLSEYYDNANLGEKALLNIGASGLNILGGVQSGANMVGALVSGKDYNPYSALGEASRLSSNIRKETGEEIAKNTNWEIAGRNVGQFAYNTLASTLDSATGVALLGPGYAAVASGNVFNQTAEQMMGKGYSQAEIWLTAGSAALAEALFEKYSIDKLVNIPKTTGFKNILKASLKQGGIEASEEVFTEISNLLTDSFFRAGTSDIKTMYDEYIKRGYTEEEAKNAIQKEIIARITEAGLGGFFSGGIMGGFQSTTQFLGNKKTADSVSVNTYNEILDAAKNMDGKLKKIADQVENAEDLSTEQKIEILDALSEAQTNEVKGSIKDELVDNGIDAEVADKMSEVISENVASDTNELKSKIEQITNDENDIQMAMDAVKSIKDGEIDLPITQAVQKVNQDIKDAREEKATREERSEAKKDFEDSLQLTETQKKYAKAKGTAKITTSSGESLTVYGFKVAAGMNSKLKTTEGRTVSFKDASFEDETMQALYQEASRLSDVELINVVLKSYKGQQNIKGYVDTINYAFDAGKISNQTNETFEKFAENKANKLLINNIGNDNYVVSKAFELGQKFVKTEEAKNAQKRKNTSNAEKITQGENELRKIEAALSDILGKEINEVEGIKDKNGNYNKAIQGQSKRNLIEINKNGRDRYKTLIHETMETMKKDNAKGYERLKKDVLEYIVETRGNKELQDTLRSYQIAYAKVGDSGAIQDVTDEFFNNVVAGLFSQERGIDQLVSWAKNNISNRFGQFLEDIADFFKKAAEEIKEFLKVNDADMSSAEKLGYQIEMNKANELRSQILEELVNVKENVDETGIEGGEEEINYSLNIETALSDYEKKQIDSFIREYRIYLDRTSKDTKNGYEVFKNQKYTITREGYIMYKNRTDSSMFYLSYYYDEDSYNIEKIVDLDLEDEKSIVRSVIMEELEEDEKNGRVYDLQKYIKTKYAYALERMQGQGTARIYSGDGSGSFTRISTTSTGRISVRTIRGTRRSQNGRRGIEHNKTSYASKTYYDVDSEGRELTQKQIEKFRNSVVRDDKGNLLVMYHGTPNALFSVFRGGSYFTPFKWYADKYQNMGASSISIKTKAEKPGTYEVYLDIKKPFDTRIPEVKKIWDEQYYRQWGTGTPLMESGLPDWTDGLDLVEFIEENELDFDGIILDEGATGGYDEEVKSRGFSWIPLNANQIKSVNNTNPTEDNDINFSVDTYAFEVWEEIANSEELKAASEIIAKASENLKNAKLDEAKVRKIASDIIKENRSTIKVDDLTQSLTAVFSYITEEADANYDVLLQIMKDIATPVLENSKAVNSAAEIEWKNMRDYLKGMKVKLSYKQKKEVESTYDSYDNYRRSLWGTIAFDEKNGTSLDSLWSEIVDKSGGRLDIMEADTNQPQALKEMIDSMKPGAYNEFGMDKEHAAFDVAMDIYRRFFIMEDEYRNNKKVKDEVEKLIKKQQEIRYKTGQKYQEKLKEVQAELKYQKARNIKELAARISQLTAEERELLAEDEIGKALIQAERLAYEKKLKALKESNDKKIAEIKAKNQQSKENQREKKKATNLRHDLKSQIDQLNKMLKSPTKDAHVKNTLVRPTIALLEAINMDTGKSKNLKEKLQQLRYMYEAYKNDQKFEFDYDENTAKMIADMELLFEGRDYTQLTNEELDQVIKIVQRLKRQIQNANKILQNEKLEDAKKTRKNIIDEIDSAKAPKNAAQEMLDKYLSMHLNAKRWARKIVGYKDGAFTELFRHLDEGQMKSMQIMKEIDKIFEPVLSGKENQKNVKQLTSIDDKDLVDVGLKNGKDEKVLITKEMRLSLILHTMNRDNMYHILFGGMTVPDLKYYHAGKFQEAYRRGDTYRFNQYYDTLRSAAIEAAKRGTPELLDKVVDDISKELRNGLMNQLNDYEKEFLQKAETMFHVYTGAVINEVSNELKGYSLASVKNYFPIKTDPDFTRTEFANLIQDRTIEGWGSLKSRIRSRNQLLMEGLSNVILRETENVSRYAGFAIPVRNVNMLLGQNVYDGSQTKSIKHSLRKKWGDSNLKWFENLMKDIQGGRMQDSNVFDDLRSKFAGATLNLNISVAMKQAASFPTAAAKLGHKPIIKAIKDIQKGFVKKQGIKELEEINPLLHYREKGLISQEFADVKSKRRLGEKISNLPGMNWIQFMDLGTVRTLEYASQYYVDDNFKDLKKGSEEYWKKVSDVFTEVVEETQPNYTVMQQADITRNPNRFLKQLFMFKTQPLQNFGLVYDAFGEFSAVMRDTKGFKEKNLSKEEVAKIEKDRKRVSENVSWAVSSMLVQAAVFNTMTLLAKALLHKKPWDEEDEEYANKDYIEQLMINYKNGMTDVFLGSLLGGAEIKNALDTWFLDKTYYDVNVSVLDTYNDLVDNVKYMKQSIEAYNNAVTEADIEKARIKIVNNGIKLLNVIGTASGVPVNNAMNLFKSGYMFTKDIVTGSPLGSSTMLDIKAVDTMYQRIEEAILDADWNRVEELRVQLVKASEAADPEQKTKENIRDKAIKEAFVNGEITKEQASEALEKIGYDDEQIVKYLSKWINLRTQNELGEEATLDDYIESAKESSIDNSSQIKSQVKEDIQNGEVTEKEAIDYLVKAGYEKNEAYFEVQKMEYDKMYGHLLSEISSQAKSGKANQKTLNDIVKEYTEHGKDKSDVASAITSNFKPIYLESKGAEKTNLYAILLKAYQSCGLTRKEAEERIKKWK